MNELTQREEFKFNQESLIQMQDFIGETMPPAEIEFEHIFASGVYARVMKAKAGSIIVGKAHKTDHICILLKGTLTVTMDDGSTKYLTAPDIWVAKAGKKKLGVVHEDLEFVNVHATESTDLSVIEQQMIIPEHEYILGVQKQKEIENMKNISEVA